MKVIFDANVLLSFLLAPDAAQTVAWIVRTALVSPKITVFVPPELVQETARKALTKPYFTGKFSRDELARFLSQLTQQGVAPPALQDEIARYVRNRGDDYLIAYGLLMAADYLVTGDRDLLVLGEVEHLRIVTPAPFRRILEERGYPANP
jgi:hypothetical protein